MTDVQLRKEKRIFADKKKILKILSNATDEMFFPEIAALLPISNLRLRALLVALLKSNDVIYNNGGWSVRKKPTHPRKQEPLYTDFDKEHEDWQKQVLASKQLRQNLLGK